MEKKTNFIILLSLACLVLVFFIEFLPLGSVGKMTSLSKNTILSRFNPNRLKKDVILIVGGDAMLGRSVLTKADRLKDYSYPLSGLASTFILADMVFVNLEAPFYDNCPRTDSGMVFCADYKMIEGLTSSGVNVVSLANNHIANYGQGGINQTQKLLTENEIIWTGMGKFAHIEVEGTKFGFLGFDLLTNQLTDLDLRLITLSKESVDVLVVGVHWGGEYQTKPSDRQKKWAKQIVEAGADVVAGHHPHWVQSMEYVDGRPVFYSLGNLVFDQMWSEETKKGELGVLTYNSGKLVKIEKRKIYIRETGTPEFVN